MSGIINGINYSLLFSSNSSTASIVGDMLNTLYSGSTSTSFSTAWTGNPSLDLKIARWTRPPTSRSIIPNRQKD